MAKLFIIGKGHIGTWLTNYFNNHKDYEVFQSQKYIKDITTDDIRKEKVDFIINAGGKTDLHWCEANREACYNNNVDQPLEFLYKLKNEFFFCPFIHLSTGCAWQGPYKKNGTVFESYDEENPACVYTESKVAFDRAVHKIFTNRYPFTILRPRLVYSDQVHPRNTLHKLNSYPKLINTPNSMSSVNIIAKTIEAMTNNYNVWNGKFVNVYDYKFMTPYKVAKMLHSEGTRGKPQLIEKEELDKNHKPKRADVVMRDIFFELEIDPMPIYQRLQEVIKKYKENLQK